MVVATAAAAKVRQRRQKAVGTTTKQQQSNKEQQNETATSPPTTDNDASKDSSSIWQTLSSHWFVRYLFPFCVLLGGMKLHPIIQKWILAHGAATLNPYLPANYQFRPPLGHYDERQLLIVGTMSAGTRQIAASLKESLKLEVGHEVSDTESYFVRDGTVSWIFGIRFLPPPTPSQLLQLCQHATKEVGFHPRMYRGGICSETEQWSKCWRKECVSILKQEWGCGQECQFQPHRITLHQTRHPLKVLSSLVAKYCQSTEQGRVAFVKITSILFSDLPSHTSCVEVAAHYVLRYNQAMIQARQQHGTIHGMYKIETTTPCQVAQLAGLSDKTTVVYPPNYKKYQQYCVEAAADDVGHQSMKPKSQYKVNQNRVQLTLQDLEGGKHGSQRPKGDTSLIEEMTELIQTMGYD